MPHLELAPGRIFVSLATVATTPQGRVGALHDLGAGTLAEAPEAAATAGLLIEVEFAAVELEDHAKHLTRRLAGTATP